jgi:rhomboid protease GluP
MTDPQGSDWTHPTVLPPNAGQEAPPPTRTPRMRSHWAIAPATYVLGGINIAVWLLMSFTGTSAIAPTGAALLHWGANYGPAVLLFDQWWRLLTAAFVHVGVVHLALNMWCLWNLGLLGEPLLGAAGMVAVYLLCGAGGNLLSVALNPGLPDPATGVVGAGASGAIFGIAGALIVLLKSKRLPLPELEVRSLRRSVIWFAVLNFVLGAGSSVAHSVVRIDNFAHLGGFLVGLAYALPMVPRIGSPRALFTRRRALATVATTLALLLLGFAVHSFYAGVPADTGVQ